MLTKLNPSEIIWAHFRSMYRYDTGKINWAEILFHIFFPVTGSTVIYLIEENISKEVVGIVVSAASIVAGLMLNLLVLIYTLAFNTKNSQKPVPNVDDFKKLTAELLASISYSILLCIALVVVSFVALSPNKIFCSLGMILTVYFGVSVLLCLLLVLKRCYKMVSFDINN